MSTSNEKCTENVENWTDTRDGEEESSLQQLKAEKNKSNLFLIKSYSFIDKTNNNNINNNNNNNNISNNNNNINNQSSVKMSKTYQEPFVDFAALATPPKKKPKKQKQTKAKAKSKNKADKNGKVEKSALDLDDQEAQLLRRNLHEFEADEVQQILQHLPGSRPGSLPRPQSLPAKVHFISKAEGVITPVELATPTKRLGIKRESFLRQSLQSIRRSFGSHKLSSKLSIVQTQSNVSSTSSTSSATSSSISTTSSTSSSATTGTISLLTRAQAQNHIMDEFLPTPVVLLLNDDPITGQAKNVYQNCRSDQRGHKRSTSSVVHTVASAYGVSSVTDERATTYMAPLQLPAKGAATTLSTKDTSGAETTALSEQRLQQLQQQQLEQLQQRRQQYIQQLSLPETFDPEEGSLPQSFSTLGAPLQPSESAHSLGNSPNQSPRSSQNRSQDSQSNSNQSQRRVGSGSGAGKGSNTAKQHEQQNSAVAAISSTSAAAAAAANGGNSGNLGATSQGSPPEGKDKEKEKKRKEVSSSRVKKFHRHFSQVSKDEKLINYFSCALVGDIPLQGHLYITEEHFAFYSNVFGYVTKVVIPTSSVTKISKEKTAKIIPNAVGVATADERHVFGSFISREAAFRLMCTVCTQLATGNEILPKPLPVDVDLPEEYLIDDDSSCSISGNESPPHLRSAIAAAVAAGGVSEPETLIRQRAISGDRHSDLQVEGTLTVDNGTPLVGLVTIRSSAPPVVHYEEQTLTGNARQTALHSNGASASSSGPTSSSSSPITVMGVAQPAVATRAAPPPPQQHQQQQPSTSRATVGGKFSTVRTRLSVRLPKISELHVLYLGILLAIMLALFSVFLLYRILDIEAKTRLYNTPVDFSLHSGNDEGLFAEALRWQKERQDKSTAEAQHILSKNLEQISKVRRSLETLSMLIHDRRGGYAQPATEVDGTSGGLEPEVLPNVHVASSSADFSD